MKKRFAILIMAVAALASCIYDFDPQIEGEGGFLVIEGDIHIGAMTDVRLSRSVELSYEANSRPAGLATVKVESEDGRVIPGSLTGEEGRYQIDTRDASADSRYRLVVEVDGSTYASEWQEPLQAAKIDSVSFFEDYERSRLSIKVSSNGSTGNRYYRWTCGQTWQYTADYYADYYYQRGIDWTRDTIVKYPNGENVYNCWSTGSVGDIMIASTTEQSENRLVDHEIFRIDRSDKRISYLYCADVVQAAISEEAYRYWTTLQKNSTDVGGLFSGEPFEMRGNIVNVDNPDELVLGYISVSRTETVRCFYNNISKHFYFRKRTYTSEVPTILEQRTWRSAVSKWAVYTEAYDEASGEPYNPPQYWWLPKEYVDCRCQGGTKSKPQWWPNHDI